ncbi:MAG TPA: HEAT repeat domain-containing protein [Chloroflexota bacterium]|nr:HEAT repeat domain-containing protein [Chloroflexota bacterium]
MPIDKDLKRLVRARMAATNENYTAARAALVPLSPTVATLKRIDLPTAVDPVDLRALISQLADPETARPARATLRLVPSEQLIPVLVEGLQSAEWRVRRDCCGLLDDLDFTPESLAALQSALDDPDPRVRRSALHTLSCQHCKPNGCALDIQPLFERLASDSSRRVREAVLNPLGYQRHGPWAQRLVERIAAHDPSELLRERARRALDRRALERAADAERRLLPDKLLRKTDRHPFKWIALDREQLIAGSKSKDVSRDFHRWIRAGDATAVSEIGLRWFFVLPNS